MALSLGGSRPKRTRERSDSNAGEQLGDDWTVESSNALMRLVGEMGFTYEAAARALHRSPRQCREHYEELLGRHEVASVDTLAHKAEEICDELSGCSNPAKRQRCGKRIRSGTSTSSSAPWSAEEDFSLLTGVAAHGCRWAHLCERYHPTRTPSALQQRWSVLEAVVGAMGESTLQGGAPAIRHALHVWHHRFGNDPSTMRTQVTKRLAAALCSGTQRPTAEMLPMSQSNLQQGTSCAQLCSSNISNSSNGKTATMSMGDESGTCSLSDATLPAMPHEWGLSLQDVLTTLCPDSGAIKPAERRMEIQALVTRLVEEHLNSSATSQESGANVSHANLSAANAEESSQEEPRPDGFDSSVDIESVVHHRILHGSDLPDLELSHNIMERPWNLPGPEEVNAAVATGIHHQIAQPNPTVSTGSPTDSLVVGAGTGTGAFFAAWHNLESAGVSFTNPLWSSAFEPPSTRVLRTPSLRCLIACIPCVVFSTWQAPIRIFNNLADSVGQQLASVYQSHQSHTPPEPMFGFDD